MIRAMKREDIFPTGPVTSGSAPRTAPTLFVPEHVRVQTLVAESTVDMPGAGDPADDAERSRS